MINFIRQVRNVVGVEGEIQYSVAIENWEYRTRTDAKLGIPVIPKVESMIEIKIQYSDIQYNTRYNTSVYVDDF